MLGCKVSRFWGLGFAWVLPRVSKIWWRKVLGV